MTSSSSRLLDGYDALLLDLDGVVYAGGRAIDHAPEALAAARSVGVALAFVTNNASRTPEEVATLLVSLGVAAAPTEVATSAQAAAHLLADELPPGSAVLVVGGEGLHHAVADAGLLPVTAAADHPVAVVQGYGADVGWRQLAEAVVAVRAGARWVATNLDLTIPSDRGILPGNGTLVAAVATALGRTPDAVAGKPEVALHRESLLRTGGSRPLVVGDRLDTDIAGANRVDADSLLVFTGVTTPEQLCRAEPPQRPTHVGLDLRALLQPVENRASTSWTATREGSRITLNPPNTAAGDAGDEGQSRLAALRAALPAAWEVVDSGEVPEVELPAVLVPWWHTGAESG